MGLARGLLGLVSMHLLANLTFGLRPLPGNGIPCSTILKQSKVHVQHQRFFFCNAFQVAFWRFLPPQWTTGRPPGRPNPAAPGHLGLAWGRGAWVSWWHDGHGNMTKHGIYSQSSIHELHHVCTHSMVDGELYTVPW